MAKKGARPRNISEHGQAAMEYLMTYGWAILVIVIVLGALLYMGVFTPPTPDICQFAPGFLCLNMRADYGEPGAICLTIANALPSTVYLCEVLCDSYVELKDITIPQQCASSGSQAILSSGGQDTVKFTGSQACRDAGGVRVEPGVRYKGKLYLFYSQAGDEKYPNDNARVAVADIVTTVQP
ncbi:MAG: hypothetical protein WC759_03540 [Candidatus Micrarchaeia archaeon]